jgi:hypothetical protein
MEGGSGPGWLSTLLLAEAWSIPPWEVLGVEHPQAWDRWKWIIRQRELINKRAQKKGD